MSQFLIETTTEDIRTYENKRGTIWATLLPYVKQAYLPNKLASHETQGGHDMMLLGELQTLSLKIIILFLHSKVSIPMYQSLLVEEDLLDYVVSLPWNVPCSCRSEAVLLTSELGLCMPNIEPPSLCNLAKAQLAKVHLGLDQLLKMTVGEIANYFYYKHHQ